MFGRPVCKVWLRCLLLVMGLGPLGCAVADSPLPTRAAAAAAVAAPEGLASPVYRITRGDELNFRFIYTPELNIQAVVRSDGRLALPLIGDIRVEGLSIAALTEQVQLALAEQVRRPQVVINVQGTGSQRVFVGGEVVRPGVQPLVGPLTVLQAVMAAEGLRESAQPAEVVLLRRGPQGETQPIRVDLSALMAGQAGAQDMPLMPYDVVLVPRSGIANLNLWIDQYIRKALPISLGFSYSINRNGTVQ
jgi:protein involved in polysaccharide export with SLBB domain